MMHQEMRLLSKNYLSIPEVEAQLLPKIEKRADFSYSTKNKPIIPAHNPVEVLAIPETMGGRRRGSMHPGALSVFSFKPDKTMNCTSDNLERSTMDDS